MEVFSGQEKVLGVLGLKKYNLLKSNTMNTFHMINKNCY